MVRHGKYIYGIEGGASGRLFRVDVSGTGTWIATIVTVLGKVQNTESGLVLHSSWTCQLEGAYQWRVRAISSDDPAYPPTGTSASAGEAVVFTQQLIVQPASAEVRGLKVNAVRLIFEEPAVTTGITHYQIERSGGTLGTEDWRVVAIVERGVNSSTATFAGAATNSGYRWDATTGAPLNVFYDMVADSDLSGPDTGDPSIGLTVNLGEYPPVGAADITAHSGRLWLAKENTLYASWLLDYDPIATDYGLVWTTVPNPDASDFLTQGASFTIGGDGDTDTIVALSQAQADTAAGDYGGVLIAFRQNSHTFISGDSPESWRAEPGRVGEHYGCLSPGGIANVEGSWVYQSPRGVQALVTNGPPRYLGELGGQFPLEPHLSQDALQTPIGYRRIRYLYYNRQLWVFAPTPGDTDGNLFPIWVWNARTNGWSWLSPPGFFSGGVVLSSQDDTGQLFSAGMDGQLYRYDRNTALDKPTPTHSGNPYTLRVYSRAHGQQSGSGALSAFSRARPLSLNLDIEQGDSATPALQWWVLPGEAAGITVATGTYTLATGRTTVTIPTIPDVRGITHRVRFDIVGAGPDTRLAGYALTCVEQGAPRQ
ncbi:MAG: hypothetical protein QM758_06805 [Armatimonas sp.]